MKRMILAACWLVIGCGVPATAADEKPDSADPTVERAQRIAEIKEKMKYFESHVGEWIGEETYELAVGDRRKTVTKDQWKGLVSLDGTHFEMHGEGTDEDGEKTTYKWICTYDPDAEIYRAWYFDSAGNSDQFEMEWDDEEKTLRWTTEDEEEDRTSTFTMKVEGNEITGQGETSRASDGMTLINHSMKYKRKRIRV
jgi:hypothetical protein